MIAARPRDLKRTYGWHRIEILAALMNGLLLCVVACGIIWEAVLRISHPSEVKTPLMLVVATIGLLANIASAALLHGSQSLNVRGAYLHILSDLLSSVAVLIGGAIMHVRHDLFVIDGVVSIGVALVIVFGAYRILREAVDILLESAPSGLDVARVETAMAEVVGVKAIHDLHVWTLSSGVYAMSAHIVVQGETVDRDALLHGVNAVLQNQFNITHTTLQLETMAFEHVNPPC